MTRYLLKRIAMLVPLFLGITLITFTVIHLAPGEPVEMQTALNPKISKETRDKLRKFYGLDQPLHVQYGQWLGRLVKFDFGNSFSPDNRPVIDKIKERIPITLSLNLIVLLLEVGLAIPIGILAATHRDTLLDKGITLFVFLGFSVPTFWLALLLMYLFGVKLDWLPISGLKSIRAANLSGLAALWDLAKHLLLPVGIATFGSLAGLSRYMRSSMLEVLGQDFITTARAKGLSERVVIYKHALRNALLPVITLLGFSLPGLIGGSVIFETIFAIPGMGQLFYQGVMARDYPLVMGILVIGALLTLIGNLLADICYGLADPRIRHGRSYPMFSSSMFVTVVWPRLKRKPFAMAGGVVIFTLLCVSLLAPYITLYDPDALDLYHVLMPPSLDHWCGTDELGRDVFTRLVYGTQISLKVGFVSVGIAVIIGTLIGICAGYYSTWVDAVLMRFVDIMLCFPTFFLILAVIALLDKPSIWYIMLIIGLTS